MIFISCIVFIYNISIYLYYIILSIVANATTDSKPAYISNVISNIKTNNIGHLNRSAGDR